MSILSQWCQQTCLTSSVSGNRDFSVTAALTCLGRSAARMRPLLPATSASRADKDDKRLGLVSSGRSNSNLTVGTELGNSDTSVGRSSTLMRRTGWWWRGDPLLSPLLQKETLHATASHWSGPICEGANIVDLHETWMLCRSMKCQALCLSLRHSLPLNANALVVVINCSTVLMYVGPGPLES